jgi:GR25 family glycosyltransferase involved in LPS biosynthesis
MDEEFDRENLKVEFFDACDGKLLGRDGIYGCARSHLDVWKDIVDKGYKNALIFEDDMRLVHNFKRKIKELIEPKEDWDLIHLYSWMAIPIEDYSPQLIRGKTLGTPSYIISNSCAQRLYRLEPDDMGTQIDLFMIAKLNLNIFFTKEHLTLLNYKNQWNSEIGFNNETNRLLEQTTFLHTLHWVDHHFGIFILSILLFLLVFYIKK